VREQDPRKQGLKLIIGGFLSWKNSKCESKIQENKD